MIRAMPRAMRCSSVVLAIVCAVPLRAYASAPASEPVVRAELELDTAKLGEDGELIEQQIRVRGDALLRNREVLPARSPDDPRIVVAIEPLVQDGPGYRCRWAVYRGAVAIAGSEGTSLCKLCTETELVDHVEAAIERAVPQVPAQASPDTSVPPADVTERPASSGKLGTLGKAGIGIGVVGVAVLATGIGLAAVDPTRNQSELGHEVGPTRPAGIALAVVGAAALISGVAMLVVDRHRARKRSAARASLAPAHVRGGAGLWLVGRF
jgi:hypothetical protein